MLFLVTYSVIHAGGSFVTSMKLETSLLHEFDVARRHVENWETIRIPAFYKELSRVTVHVLSFQEIKP